jgi:hypothetical protein
LGWWVLSTELTQIVDGKPKTRKMNVISMLLKYTPIDKNLHVPGFKGAKCTTMGTQSTEGLEEK